jgi:hypothetical protein
MDVSGINMIAVISNGHEQTRNFGEKRSMKLFSVTNEIIGSWLQKAGDISLYGSANSSQRI